MTKAKTMGDELPSLIIKREKLRADLKDMAAAYRDQIRELEEQIKERAFNADQIEMALDYGEGVEANV